MKLLLLKRLTKFLFIAMLFASNISIGQLTLPGTSPYTQDFNTTPGPFGTTYPTGWISYNNTTQDAAMTVGNSASGTGANYNYTNRIGLVGSGSNFLPGSIVLAITNTTGKTSLKISYDIVKIREQGRSNGFDLEISTTSATSGFTAVSGGGYASGTIAENVVSPYTNIDISGIDNQASTVWLRWHYYEISGSGSRDGIALDNVSLSWSSGPVMPSVTTTMISSITTNSASSGGNVTADGGAAVTSRGVYFGTTAVPTSGTSDGTGTGTYTSSLTGLSLNTQYFYRSFATNSIGTSYGSELNFYTLAATPGVLVVSNPTQNTLDVAVNTTTENSNPSNTEYAIQETGGLYVQANGSLGATAVWQTAATWATVTVTGLSSSTSYTFQTKARNGSNVETGFGATASDTTTAPLPPVVTSGSTSGTYNVSLSYSIIASNSPTAYALSSGTLPTGLSLDTATGVISGTPTEVGTFNTNFTASNAGGTSAPAAITITINKASQTITFAALSPVTYGDAPFALTGSSSSGLTISYMSSDPAVASISGNTVTIVGQGTATITASQAGDANYTAASSVDQSLTVNVKNLTISGLTANDKVEDGTTDATLTGTPSLVGVVVGDETVVILTGSPTAAFASATPAAGIVVNVSGYSLTGAKAANYSVSQPTLTATITALGIPNTTAATSILVDGFTANWEAVADATSYRLDVSTSPTFSGSTVSVAEWTFPTDGTVVTPDVSTPSNAAQTLTTNGGTIISSAGNSTESASANAWQSGDGTKYWQIDFDATGFSNIALSSAQRSSNSGPKDFKIQYKVGVGSWTDTGTDVVVANNFSTGVASLTLPSACDNQSNVSVRWIMTSNTSVNNGTVAGGGTSRIDDIIVTSTTSAFIQPYEDLNVGNVTSYDVTGLEGNTQYYYRVRSVLGSSTSANSTVIDVTTADDTCVWSSLAWSNVTGPTEQIEATIADAYDTTTYGEITTKKLTIATAGSLVINSGTNVFVINEVINNASASALLVESNGNLLQINDVSVNVNVGDITVNRETSELKRLDYVLWSSPVDGQLLQAFSPATLSNRFYTYDAGTNLYALVASPSTTSFSVGTGFLIRTPNNHPTTPAIWSSVFTGLPHNGDFSVAVANDTYNAVGNPYPSTLDADSFMADNAISEALYFWRKENNSANPSYATYTNAGGVANTGGNSALIPSSAIQVGQGFIAKSTSTSLNFTNSMRVADNDNLFLKSSNTVDKSRIWLDLTNTDGLFCQTLIGYMSTATSGVDSRIDGRIFSQPTNGATLTSIIGNDSSYIIQGKGTFVDTDVVPLAFKTAVSGNFTIALSNVDGLFANNAQDVFLKDNLTNTITNLTNGDYAFATAIGDFLNRFEVVYQSTVLNTDNFTSNNLVVYTQTNGIVINAGSDLLSNVKVFDVRGRLLLEKANLNDSEVVLNISKSNEVLLVQVTNQYGNVITKKVIN
ncbi:YDG domain-containing protein [Flavobacterium gelidilacus]|uniref:YDG domain-containing protein n=1 Tax=Flavobacterium gelidilacus TaxID=206041 RepID=UPI0003F657D5|nr:YDG domain-containing protein [Flavobacterium gelidilacus]